MAGIYITEDIHHMAWNQNSNMCRFDKHLTAAGSSMGETDNTLSCMLDACICRIAAPPGKVVLALTWTAHRKLKPPCSLLL